MPLTSVEQYIQSAPEAGHPHLNRLYQLLQDVAPEADVAIKWNMPFFTEPRFLFCFSAHKAHLNFTPNEECLAFFSGELKDYKTTKKSLQVRYDEQFPEGLIRTLAEYRVDVVSSSEDESFWI